VVEDLTRNFGQRAAEIMAQVERIRDFLAHSAAWTISFTGSAAAFAALGQTLESWAGRRRRRPATGALPPFEPGTLPWREGLAGPMQIAHCVQSMPAPHLAHPDTPLFQLGIYLAGFDYLLPEIRFKGNAYGGGARYDDTHNTLNLYSYFDPRITETLAVFDGLGDHLKSRHWSQTDIDRAIIGSAKEAEAPIRPGRATGLALMRHVRGDSDELRAARYAAALRATPESVKETTLRVLDANASRTAVCVVSSREKLEEANRQLGEKQLAVSDILA
jgi:Zn-dependent M16 (insulinase) family peptidase